MCEHNDHTHGEMVNGHQLVICEDCGCQFDMQRPELGWHQAEPSG